MRQKITTFLSTLFLFITTALPMPGLLKLWASPLQITKKSTQLYRQIFGSKVGITAERLEILMAGDRCHFHYP